MKKKDNIAKNEKDFSFSNLTKSRKIKVEPNCPNFVYQFLYGSNASFWAIFCLIILILFGSELCSFTNAHPLISISIAWVAGLVGLFIAVGTKEEKILNYFIGHLFGTVTILFIASYVLPFYHVYFVYSIFGGIIILGAVLTLISMFFSKLFAKPVRSILISLIIGCLIEVVLMHFGQGGDVANWVSIIVMSLIYGGVWHKAQGYSITVKNAILGGLELYIWGLMLYMAGFDLFPDILELVGDILD